MAIASVPGRGGLPDDTASVDAFAELFPGLSLTLQDVDSAIDDGVPHVFPPIVAIGLLAGFAVLVAILVGVFATR